MSMLQPLVVCSPGIMVPPRTLITPQSLEHTLHLCNWVVCKHPGSLSCAQNSHCRYLKGAAGQGKAVYTEVGSCRGALQH